ncbi:hypothetical protein AVEN_4159-1, partial [Araneus ventricosus]
MTKPLNLSSSANNLCFYFFGHNSPEQSFHKPKYPNADSSLDLVIASDCGHFTA